MHMHKNVALAAIILLVAAGGILHYSRQGSADQAPDQISQSDPVSEQIQDVVTNLRGQEPTHAMRAVSTTPGAVPEVAEEQEAETELVPYEEDWAAFHPLAEKNARHRAQKIHKVYTDWATAENYDSRHGRAWALARVSVYTLMDYDRTSKYRDEAVGGIMLRPKPGFTVWGNGGAAYEVPVGKYPVFDALADRGAQPLNDDQIAELEALYARAAGVLEPYTN